MKASSAIFPILESGPVQARFGQDGPSELLLGHGASAEYLVLQAEADDATLAAEYAIRLSEGASLRMVFLSLCGGAVRNRIRVSLSGPYAACELAGLYLPAGSQRMEYDVLLEHLVPDCHSTQLFKGILDDHAVSRFDGLVKVVPDAQRTEAYQANHNLLLSETAKAHTQPQLEIYADDVKCSHGATVGRLNPDELFYMRTRGIPVTEARLLQQMAFANEVVEKITQPELREKMRLLVEKRLRGEKI